MHTNWFSTRRPEWISELMGETQAIITRVTPFFNGWVFKSQLYLLRIWKHPPPTLPPVDIVLLLWSLLFSAPGIHQMGHYLEICCPDNSRASLLGQFSFGKVLFWFFSVWHSVSYSFEFASGYDLQGWPATRFVWLLFLGTSGKHSL